MRPGLLVLGIAMIFISLLVLSGTEGGLFLYGMLLVGLLFVFSGLAGRRSFICMNCRHVVETDDSAQGEVLSCPHCQERYILHGKKLISFDDFIRVLSEQEGRPCPACGKVMTIDIDNDRWRCEGCGQVEGA